jgi:hypothetical protein
MGVRDVQNSARYMKEFVLCELAQEPAGSVYMIQRIATKTVFFSSRLHLDGAVCTLYMMRPRYLYIMWPRYLYITKSGHLYLMKPIYLMKITTR